MVFCRCCGNELPSENVIFCKNCDDQSDDNINRFYEAFVFDKRENPHKTPEYIKILAGKGKIIIGIFLFLLGIVVAGNGLFIYTIQFNDLQTCNLISFNQLDQNYPQACYKSGSYLSEGIIFGSIGEMFIIFGIILIAFGIKKKNKPRILS